MVSNTSPILNLAVIGQLSLLQGIYPRVFIPKAVLEELLAIGSERLGNMDISSCSWIEPRTISNRLLVDSLLGELDSGEAVAIVLAVEMKADLVLLNERRARNVASRLGLRYVGLLGLLVETKRKGLLPAVKPVLDSLLVQAGFWVGNSLYARILQEVQE